MMVRGGHRAGLFKFSGDHALTPKYMPAIEARWLCLTTRSQVAVMISKVGEAAK